MKLSKHASHTKFWTSSGALPAIFHRTSATLTTWPFIAALAVLILNDSWLKHTHPGVISGKLSDFAGIAVVTLLLASHPIRKGLVFGLIGGGFAWWKSTLSQPVIDAINHYAPYPIGRVVDYTDLVALLIIPSCIAVTVNPAAFAVPGKLLRRLLLGPTIVLTTLALTATSTIPTRQDYQVRRTDSAAELDRSAIADTVAHVAEQHGLKCVDCADKTSSGRYKGNGINLWYVFIGGRSASFQVEAYPNGLIFGKSGKDKAESLRQDLKSRLANSHKDLEYVEQLSLTSSARQ